MSLLGALILFAAGLAPTLSFAQQPDYGAQRDPNLPNSFRNANIEVAYGPDPLMPSIILGPRYNRMGQNASYLGYNSDGTWLVNPSDAKIFVWNLKTNTVTERFGNYKLIPADILATLRNPQEEALAAAARENPPPRTSPPKPAANQTTNNSRALVGDQSQAVSGLLAQAMANRQGQEASGTLAAGAGFSGSAAKIQGGVLTFTTPEGKAATYNVVRPKNMASNPQAYVDTTGTWIATEPGGKGILFMVQADRSVTGKEMAPQIIQMMLH